MPPYSQMSATQLRKRLHEVEQALADATPLYSEMRLLERLLAAKTDEKPLYAGITTIVEAIEQALTIHGVAMTKDTMYQVLTVGGYGFKPSTGRTLVGNTLNYHGKTGRLKREGELFGLPQWKIDRFVD